MKECIVFLHVQSVTKSGLTGTVPMYFVSNFKSKKVPNWPHVSFCVSFIKSDNSCAYCIKNTDYIVYCRDVLYQEYRLYCILYGCIVSRIQIILYIVGMYCIKNTDYIVYCRDVYENTYNGVKCLLVVMEW